jgi:beta-phosphoglucomutase-like phosphatase (HAD superfamily)
MAEIINKYDLFIFDLDDTLVKTENYHYNAWLRVLKNEFGNDFHIDFATFISKFHSNIPDSIKIYLANELKIENWESILQKKNKLYLEIIGLEQKNIKMIDGVENFLHEIIKNNKKFVIVSNSLKSNIDFFSELFPVLKKSSKNYYRELFKNKKPNPECYLKVVEDFPNCRMVGFEDSITGIHAMMQVQNIDTFFINDLEYYYYNYIIENYKLKMVIKDYNHLF